MFKVSLQPKFMINICRQLLDNCTEAEELRQVAICFLNINILLSDKVG